MRLFSLTGAWKATIEWSRARTCRCRAASICGRFGIVLAITFFYRKVLPVNATTVALTFLLAILAVSTFWGIAVSVSMSVAAMLAFNYYFLPPIGTFTIADPQNWVALFAFLVVSVLASHLSTARGKQAEDASARRREVEKLYSFSQGLARIGQRDSAAESHSRADCGHLRSGRGGSVSRRQAEGLSLRARWCRSSTWRA